MSAAADADLDLDVLVERLAAGERAWAGTTLTDRRDLLLEIGAATAAHSEEWVRVATAIKGLDPSSPLVGEEWMSGPYAVLSYVGSLQQTLQRLSAGTSPLEGYPITRAPGDRSAVHVLPHDAFDRLLLSGFRAEVWTRPGVTERQVRTTAGLAQRSPGQTNGVALVLGAGNIFSIAPLDVLYQLFADNRTVVLKLNPTTDLLAEVYRAVFAPLIARNLAEIVSGGAELGGALAQHPGISAVHLTGSEATHDAVVWGTGPEGAAARSADIPRLAKPITSELGGVCPVIVVPGRWSRADIRFQAEHVATQRLHNSGANCVASQIVIVSSDWPQKAEFLRALRDALTAAPVRPSWYPGCAARVSSARDVHPAAEDLGRDGRTLIVGLDLADPAETAFGTEYFGPVLGVAELPGTGAAFLDVAVTAANERLRGTLGANVIVHPRTRRELGQRFLDAIADLRYGTIGVNAWTAVGYLTARATWGAFPGHTLDDVQSGTGVVHNALLLDHVERTVVTGPFRPAPRSVLHGELSMSPKPPWFVGNRTAADTGRLLTGFAARPRSRALPGIFASALRG